MYMYKIACCNNLVQRIQLHGTDFPQKPPFFLSTHLQAENTVRCSGFFHCAKIYPYVQFNIPGGAAEVAYVLQTLALLHNSTILMRMKILAESV